MTALKQSIHLIVANADSSEFGELDIDVRASMPERQLNDLTERIRAMVVLQFPSGDVAHSRITPAQPEEVSNG